MKINLTLIPLLSVFLICCCKDPVDQKAGKSTAVFNTSKTYGTLVDIDGNIYKTIYYPGCLWPVNSWSVNNVNELFCQNERTVSLIKSESNHSLAFIAVAATMVGKISLTYTQIQDRKAHKFIEQTHKNICLPKGEELGKFMFGSTIILLFNKNMMSKFAKNQGEVVKMGEKLAFGQI